MWVALAVLLVAVILTIVLVTMLLVRGRTQALVKVDRVQTPEPVDDEAALKRLIRDLAPLFSRSITRLRKKVRGVDVRYGVPWYLLVGPVDEGKEELLADAVQTASARPDAFARAPDAAGSVAWHYFSGGVVIDVGARLVFPSTARRDLTGWRALLELLKRHRPRRPIDGILLAIPAPLLLDEQWKRRAEDLGLAIRERLAIAQGELGFALPVYVLLTQSDRIRGFSAFAQALPDALRQDMVGWSNPHAPELVFQGTWIDEGLDALHRGIVHLLMEIFAGTGELDRPSDLLLFSGELPRLATPLRTLLEEIFRPTAYSAALSFRGFYLCGEAAFRPEVTLVDGGGVMRARSAAFLGDLLDRKVFPERGLASPLAGTLSVGTRTSLIARATAAALVLILAIGSYFAYGRLRTAELEHVGFLQTVIDALHRRQSVDVETGLDEGYGILIRLESISRHPFRSFFYPTSWLSPMDAPIGDVLRATFNDVLLPHLKAGLEAKGRRLFERNPADDGDDEPANPVLENDPSYQALRQFSKDYVAFVESYVAYEDSRHEEGGSVGQVAQLANYVTGRSQVTLNLPDLPYGHALREASSNPLDCSFAEPFARVKAERLLARFEASWFGENNPVRLSADSFAEAWEALTDRAAGGSLSDVDGELTALAQAVTSWGIVAGHARDLRVPVFDQAPFSRMQRGELCPALVPDLSADIRRVAAGRDALTDTLLTVEAAPFGPLLEDRNQVLRLIPELQELATSFDVLHKQPFWVSVQAREGALPARVTWRPQALEDLKALFEVYETYRTSAFGDLDPAYRRPLLQALDREVGRRLEMRLTFEATDAPPLPVDGPALLAEIGRLDTILERIAPIVEHLQDANEPFARRLTSVLSGQATEALRRLDREAVARHPYLADPRTDALSVALSEAMRNAAAGEGPKRWAGFVDEHRESLRRFALAAEPIVHFFQLTGATSPLVQRWSGIVVDVEQYDQKIGNSGLATLETFLRDTYPAIVPERDCAPPRTAAVSRASGTLAPIRNQLLDEAVRRCRADARAAVEGRYETIAGEFTRLLAGKFPFSALAEGVREATVAEAIAFFRAYESQGGPSLAQQLDALSCGQDAIGFMRRVDALAPLLATSRDLQTAVAVDIVPEFRVNREAEIGGNQVVAWDLSVGRQTFRDTEPVKTGRWTSGDRIRLELRFAADSPLRPFARPDGGFSVDGRTARFDFGGSWALLALVAGHRAPSGELRGLRDDAPHTLRFEIPVERDAVRPPLTTPTTVADRFRVFMRLRLLDPAKKDVLLIEDIPRRPPGRVSCTGQEGSQR